MFEIQWLFELIVGEFVAKSPHKMCRKERERGEEGKGQEEEESQNLER